MLDLVEEEFRSIFENPTDVKVLHSALQAMKEGITKSENLLEIKKQDFLKLNCENTRRL